MTRLSLFVSVFTSALTIALIVIGFLGSNPHAEGLKKVNWMKMRVNQIPMKEGGSGGGDISKSEFSIGTAGYCEDGTCHTGRIPFYFNIQKDTMNNDNDDDDDEMNKEMTDVQSKLKKGGIAIYILTLAAAAAHAISFLIALFGFLLSCLSRTVGKIIVFFGIFFSLLGVIAHVAAAGVGTGIYTSINKKFDGSSSSSSDYIETKIGAGGYAVYWIGFVVGFISLCAMISALFSSRRKSHAVY